MEFLSMYLPIMLYILAIILLIVLIVLGFKLICAVDKVNEMLDEIEKKTKSLNGFFYVIDNFSNSLTSISDGVIDGVINLVSKIIKKRKKEKEIDE